MRSLLATTALAAAVFAAPPCRADAPEAKVNIADAFDLSRPMFLREDSPDAAPPAAKTKAKELTPAPPEPRLAPPDPSEAQASTDAPPRAAKQPAKEEPPATRRATPIPPAEPPVDVQPTPEAAKRLAQLERAATEAATAHAFGRIATQAEDLAYDEPTVRGDALRLASWGYTSRGRKRAAAGGDDAALEDFNRAVELAPRSLTPRHDRAISLAEMGEDREALAELNRVVELAPKWVAARRNRAMVLLSLGEFEAVLDDCDAALARAQGPERARLFELSGRALQQLGRIRQAASCAENGLAEAPDEPALVTLRGDLSAELGFAERAVEDYFAVLEEDPANPEVYRRLAWVLATTPVGAVRDPRMAVEAADRARKLGYGNDPLALEASAAAYAAAGDFGEAVRFQSRAILAAGEAASAGMDERLALYRSNREFVVTTPDAGAAASSVQQVGFDERAGGR